MGDSRRRWSPEFKRDAVALVRSSGRPISAVARELGCGESSLGYWLTKDRQSRAAADPERFAAEQAESEEIKRLRRRVAAGGGTRDPETICGLVGEGVDAVSKYAFIEAHRAEFHVVDLCRVGGVSTSGFYDRQARQAAGPTAAERLEADLVAEIREIHARSRRGYGCPRVGSARCISRAVG